MFKKISNIKFLIVIVIIVLGFSSLLLIPPTKPVVKNVPAMPIENIKSEIADGGQIIDVRTADEYKVEHIESAVNLSLQDIQSGKLPEIAKDKPLYLYCRSGNRSGQATKILKAAGYSNIIDLGAMTHVQSMGGKTVK